MSVCTHKSGSATVSGSPRRIDAVYILCVGPCIALGTAFAVSCRAQNLAVTAAHCIVRYDADSACYKTCSDQLFLTKKLRALNDGQVATDGERIFSVRVIKHDMDCDLAVLELTDSNDKFADTIDLCPAEEMPTPKREDQVKLYHASLTLFPDEVQAISPEASKFVKLAQEDSNRYWIQLHTMPGSSGGPLLDIQGRAVGVLRSGYTPQLALTIVFPRVFEERIQEHDGGVDRMPVCHEDEYSHWSGHASTQLSKHYTQFIKTTARGFTDYINSHM